MSKSTKYQYNRSQYEVLETIPKLSILTFYIKSIFIGLWVLMKWFVYLLWSSIIQSTKNKKTLVNYNQSSHLSASESSTTTDHYVERHNKPPSILVDNKIGRHSYVKLKDVKLHYVEAGDESNPLVLLLHGFPDCWIGWRNQIYELSRFFRVVALDMKGFNDSDKPIWRQVYTPKKICSELLEFIYAIGYSNVTIIGHDIGAIIGWFFVHTNPDNIDRFICVSAPHPNIIWDNLHQKSVMNTSWLQFIQMPLLPELDHSSKYSTFLEKYFKSVKLIDNNGLTSKNSSKYMITIKNAMTNRTNTNEDTNISGGYNNGIENGYENDYDLLNFSIIDTYKYVFNRRTDWTGPLNYYRNFPFYRIKEGNNVRCPVLIVTGNQDKTCQLESIVKSTDYCDSFVFKIIEGAGHWPHQQIPIEFNKVILSFLVGRRAQQPLEQLQTDKVAMKSSIMGHLLGAVSQSVKIGTSVLDSVQQRTNNLIQGAASYNSGIVSDDCDEIDQFF